MYGTGMPVPYIFYYVVSHHAMSLLDLTTFSRIPSIKTRRGIR